NAADAAALAGARALSVAVFATDNTVATAICKYAVANTFGTTPQVTGAYYVKSDGTRTGTNISTPTNCSGTPHTPNIPSNASGVCVVVEIGPYPTYILGILRVSSLTANASACSMVGSLNSLTLATGSNYYIAACGFGMVLTSNLHVENIFV